MKTVMFAGLVLVGIPLFTGCTIGANSGGGGNSGGIDPVTMRGIEDSNRATDEAVRRQSQEAIDQANLNTMQQANQQAADAASAAAAAAAAAAANQ